MEEKKVVNEERCIRSSISDSTDLELSWPFFFFFFFFLSWLYLAW